MRWLAWVVSCGCVVLGGCAAGGDPGDGGSGLPDRGLGGYAVVVDEAGDAVAPVVVEGRSVGAPMAVVVGGRVVLYVEVCEGDACDVMRAESDDGIVFGGLTAVAEGVRSPFVVRGDGGWWLYGRRGDGIVRAWGDGRAFGEAVEVLGEAGAVLDSPSVVEVDGRVALYVSRSVEGGTGLGVAMEGGDGFGDVVPLVVPGVVDGWDPGEVAGAEVRRAVTGAGRVVYRLVHGSGARGDVGFAASFDGVAWVPYAFNPAVGEAVDERAPSNVRLGGRYLLYYGRGRGVGVAERVVENASEGW